MDSSNKHDYYRHEEITQDKTTNDGEFNELLSEVFKRNGDHLRHCFTKNILIDNYDT